MKIRHETEALDLFALPSIPTEKNVWDGKSSFKDGIAVTNLMTGEQAYAACTFDAERDKEPRIVKVFAQEPFRDVERIYVVPSYMNTNVSSADLDEESRKAAERLAEEARELTEIEDENPTAEDNANGWVFDNVHNAEEAKAFIASYNKRNKIKGKVPASEETLKLRLLTIQDEMKRKKRK